MIRIASTAAAFEAFAALAGRSAQPMVYARLETALMGLQALLGSAASNGERAGGIPW